MKKYNNFCITWMEGGRKNETVIFSKPDTIRKYINLLCAYVDCGRDISSLKIIGITRNKFIPEDITNTVNKFLSN